MVNGCYAFFPRRCHGTYYICLWFAGRRHHEEKLSTAAMWCHRCYPRGVLGGCWVLPTTRPALVPVSAGSGACFQLPLFTSSFEDMFPQVSGHLREVRLRLLTHTLSAPKSHYMMTGQSFETLENGSHFPSTWASTQIIQSSVVKVRPARRKTDSPKTRVPKTKSELPVTQKPP